MAKYLNKVRALTSGLKHLSISHIPGCENAKTNALSRLMTSTNNSLDRTYIECLKVPALMKSRKFNKSPMNWARWILLSSSWLKASVLTISQRPRDSNGRLHNSCWIDNFTKGLSCSCYLSAYSPPKLTMYFERCMKESMATIWGISFGLQSLKAGILLAYYASRCHGVCSEVRSMPMLCQYPATTN